MAIVVRYHHVSLPLPSPSFGFVFFAIDFFSLRAPEALSFLGSTFPAAGSTRLISELEAIDAGGFNAVSDESVWLHELASIPLGLISPEAMLV